MTQLTYSTGPQADDAVRPCLSGHLAIMRIDHWVKNVFVLPGILVALAISPNVPLISLSWAIVLGLFATCLVASSNYVINEVLDAPSDRSHPEKCQRPVPSGRVHVPLAYAQWIALMVAGLAIGFAVSPGLGWTLATLWIMGCVYNIPPVRSKDVAYIDVLSESVNNPLRMLAGWFIVDASGAPPASLLLSYWMIGAYFMAIKRFAEYRAIDDAGRAADYRKSFAWYTQRKLLVSIMFYASAAMMFFGAFMMRYRLEMLLAVPLIALVMTVYIDLGFKRDSAVQAPEKLHREPKLMAAVVGCMLVMLVMLFVDVPALHALFAPTAQAQAASAPMP